MVTRKVTVTLDEAQVERMRALVEAGSASSLSGSCSKPCRLPSTTSPAWAPFSPERFCETGGALSDEERAWADGVLGVHGRTTPAA